MTRYDGNDIYCDLIIPKKINYTVVKETTSVLAFFHTKPHWPVHIVITLKKHVPSILELEEDSNAELLSVIQEIAGTVMREKGACRIITNLGMYQDSKHLHYHVIYEGTK